MRISIVCPRFWPYSGSIELSVGDLAASIVGLGHDAEVLTAGWEKLAPATFQQRNFLVRRFYRSTSNPWGNYRYQKQLKRYLQTSQTDGIIFFDANYEYFQLAKSFTGQIPLAVRLYDHQLPQFRDTTHHARHSKTLQLADRVIVETENTVDRLLGIGVATERICVADDVIAPANNWDQRPVQRSTARRSIALAHPMLAVQPGQPLMICAAGMHGDQGMSDLVDAWNRVIRHSPAAKLWIIGYGPASRKLWDLIVARRLTDSVLMIGQFDNMADVFLAADGYLHPLRGSAPCSMLGRAMLSGICPIVCQPLAQQLNLANQRQAVVVGAGLPGDLADAALRLIGDRQAFEAIGLAAADWAAARYDISQSIQTYLSFV